MRRAPAKTSAPANSGRSTSTITSSPSASTHPPSSVSSSIVVAVAAGGAAAAMLRVGACGILGVRPPQATHTGSDQGFSDFGDGPLRWYVTNAHAFIWIQLDPF